MSQRFYFGTLVFINLGLGATAFAQSQPHSVADGKVVPLSSPPKTLSELVVPPKQDEKSKSQENTTPKAPTSTKRPQLSVDKMIRQPVDQLELFSRVHAKHTPSEPIVANPMVRSQSTSSSTDIDWTPSGYCWQSPAFCYSPLYFEQPNLERYGTSPGHWLSPAVSASFFFGQVVAFPLKSFRHPFWSKDCTLGHHRPGNCTPHQTRPTYHRAGNLSAISTQTVDEEPMFVTNSESIESDVSSGELAASAIRATAIAAPPAVHVQANYQQERDSSAKAEKRRLTSP